MAESYLAITNGVVFTGDALISNQTVLIKGDKVFGIVPTSEIPAEAEIVDANGGYVTPGFVDLQIYGGGSRLFSADPTAAALDEIAHALVKSGTTSFMITMATNPMELVDDAMGVLRGYQHPALLGLHLEGPYLNPKKRGAHPEAYMRKPEKSEIKSLLERAGTSLRMMTVAPEQFDEDVIDLLLNHGVILSAGHSNATFDEAMYGFQKGIQAVTHFFNAMSPFHHRNPGLPGATFQSDTVKASIIADGIHVNYQTLAISKRLLGDRLFLITDAVVAVDNGTYTHIFAGDRYTLPDGTLSGSALTMMQTVANCVRHAGIPLEEALRMATIYPASLIGANDIGRIAAGATANLVIFDENYIVQNVFLGGVCQ